jgi:hypothetical protein
MLIFGRFESRWFCHSKWPKAASVALRKGPFCDGGIVQVQPFRWLNLEPLAHVEDIAVDHCIARLYHSNGEDS